MNRGTAISLIVINLYSIITVSVLWLYGGLPTVISLALALPLILLAPGYTLITALFSPSKRPSADPGDDHADAWISPSFSRLEKVVLAIIVSIATVPMVAIAANFTFGLSSNVILAGVVGVTILASGIAFFRSPTETSILASGSARKGLLINNLFSRIYSRVTADRITLPAIAITILLLTASAAVAFSGDTGTPPNTEFYLVNSTDTSNDLGTTAQDNEADSTTAYELQIDYYGVDRQQFFIVVVKDQTPPGAQASTQSMTELARIETSVEPEDSTSEIVHVNHSDTTEEYTLRFLLYKGTAPSDPDPSTAFRELKLTVTPN